MNGVLMIETGGTYSFRAGAPMPGHELPDFEKANHASWQVTLKRGQKEWAILSQNMPGENAPGECSAPITLRRGAYHIDVKYLQLALNFGKDPGR